MSEEHSENEFYYPEPEEVLSEVQTNMGNENLSPSDSQDETQSFIQAQKSTNTVRNQRH